MVMDYCSKVNRVSYLVEWGYFWYFSFPIIGCVGLSCLLSGFRRWILLVFEMNARAVPGDILHLKIFKNLYYFLGETLFSLFYFLYLFHLHTFG